MKKNCLLSIRKSICLFINTWFTRRQWKCGNLFEIWDGVFQTLYILLQIYWKCTVSFKFCTIYDKYIENIQQFAHFLINVCWKCPTIGPSPFSTGSCSNWFQLYLSKVQTNSIQLEMLFSGGKKIAEEFHSFENIQMEQWQSP